MFYTATDTELCLSFPWVSDDCSGLFARGEGCRTDKCQSPLGPPMIALLCLTCAWDLSTQLQHRNGPSIPLGPEIYAIAHCAIDDCNIGLLAVVECHTDKCQSPLRPPMIALLCLTCAWDLAASLQHKNSPSVTMGTEICLIARLVAEDCSGLLVVDGGVAWISVNLPWTHR